MEDNSFRDFPHVMPSFGNWMLKMAMTQGSSIAQRSVKEEETRNTVTLLKEGSIVNRTWLQGVNVVQS